MKAEFSVRNFNPWGHNYSKGTVTVLALVKLYGTHLFVRQHRITYPTTIWLSCLKRALNETQTKNYCKKKRAKFILGQKDKANLKNKIHFCLNKIFNNDKNIETAGLYFPMNNEVSSSLFINYLEKKNVILSLPVIDAKTKYMSFKRWKPDDKLIKGPLGNLEPILDKKSIIPQILVVPLLSFDEDLYRLGYGGGYYDKTIKILKNYFKKEQKFFITIGLAYSIQKIDKIPRENHDMSLDYIITENEVLSSIS